MSKKTRMMGAEPGEAEAWLRGDVEGLVALEGGDADELLRTRDVVRLCCHGEGP